MQLRKLARSAPITIIAVAAMFNLACSLPAVKPRMAPEFAKGKTKVKSIAVLPMDLSVQVEGEDNMVRTGDGIGTELMERIYNGISKSLHKRGYRVKAFVEPDGRTHHKKKLVIHPSDLAALRVEIHESTAAFGPGPGYIGMSVSSPLTRQIQATTGADASLYARGWIYIGREDSAALTAVKIIGIAIFAIVIVGLLVMMLAGAGKGKKSKGKKSKARSSRSGRSRRSSGGGAARALFGATRAVVKTAAAVGRVTVRAMPHVLNAAARARCDVPCHTCPPPPPPPAPPPPVVEEPGMVMDNGVVGDKPGEVMPPEALPAPPVPASRPAAPPAPVKQARDPEIPRPRRLVLHQGKPPTKSTVSLAVSLVHNRNGRVLWHAGQTFSVKVDPGYNVQAFIDHFFENLPRAR